MAHHLHERFDKTRSDGADAPRFHDVPKKKSRLKRKKHHTETAHPSKNLSTEDIDINGPRQLSQTWRQNSTPANLFQRACERVVNQIVDKLERIAKNLKDEAKTKEELSKRQPEWLLEQYVPVLRDKDCGDNTSARRGECTRHGFSPQTRFKRKQTGSNAGKTQNLTTPGAAQGEAKKFRQRKRQGEGPRQAQKQIERQRIRQSYEQDLQEKLWQRKEEHIQRSRLWKRRRKHGGKTGRKSKGQKPSTTR